MLSDLNIDFIKRIISFCYNNKCRRNIISIQILSDTTVAIHSHRLIRLRPDLYEATMQNFPCRRGSHDQLSLCHN